MFKTWQVVCLPLKRLQITQVVLNDNKKIYNNPTTQMLFFLNDAKKQYIFAETCLYEVVGSLPVMPSLLPHVL
jgi:hypothetical protein